MSEVDEAAVQMASTVKQTIVAHLEAPRLQGTTTKDFTKFVRERELYEKQVAEKNLSPDVSINAVTYKASIDDSILRMFMTFGWIPADTVDEISEQSLKDCIQKRANREPKDHELGRVDTIVSNVHMNTSISLLEDRVYDLVQKYLQVLEGAGLKELPKQKPHISIKHILKRIKPKSLYKCMIDIIEWRKNEQFDRKNFGLFVQELAKQASRMDEDGSHLLVAENENSIGKEDKKSPSSKNKKFSKRQDEGKNPHHSEEKRAHNSKGQKKGSSDHLPVCLNEKCDLRHYMNDCHNTSPEEKKRLLAEYRLKKKRSKGDDGPSAKKHAGGINKVSEKENANHNSSLFSASFCKGAVESIALTDQGSDVNLVSPSVMEKIKNADSELSIYTLNPPKIFSSIVQKVKVTCYSYFVADIQLRIRHGTNLIIRSVKWLVGDVENDHVTIGRPLLDSLGCSNEKMLAAACDRNDGVFNAQDVQYENEVGSIESLLSDGIFHSAGGIEDDNISDDVYIDIGEDAEGEVEAALESRVQKAIENGLSQNGAQRLRKLLNQHRPIFD